MDAPDARASAPALLPTLVHPVKHKAKPVATTRAQGRPGRKATMKAGESASRMF